MRPGPGDFKQRWSFPIAEWLRRDVIEQPIAGDLDVSGLELRKALRLLRKSNPPLLEWLKSPVVYRHDPVFAAEFGALATEFYSPRRCFAHYLHMAFGNWRDYLRGREEVSLKKYLYVFRPLLACRWIERQLGQVPMLFAQLVEAVLDEADVRSALAELVARKQAGEELAVAPPVQALSRFIEAELPRLEALNEPDDATRSQLERRKQPPPSVSAIRQHRLGNPALCGS